MKRNIFYFIATLIGLTLATLILGHSNVAEPALNPAALPTNGMVGQTTHDATQQKPEPKPEVLPTAP